MAGKRTRRRQPPLTTSREALLVDGSDAAFRQLVHDIFGLAARHQEVRDGHAARVGLAGAQYTTLVAIAHLGRHGPVSVKGVADHLHVSPAFVTAETKKLEASGLVTKRRSNGDGRVVDLELSDAGFDKLDGLSATQRRVNDEQFAHLDAAEFRELSRLVRLMIDNSDRAIALQRYLATGEHTA